MPEIIARSCCSRYFATSQPRLTVPTTLALGSRPLSKNVSQNGDRPEIKRIGFVDTPFDAMSNRIKLMPSCFLADGSVRTRQEDPVGVVGVGGPDLLAVDDKIVAVALGAGL